MLTAHVNDQGWDTNPHCFCSIWGHNDHVAVLYVPQTVESPAFGQVSLVRVPLLRYVQYHSDFSTPLWSQWDHWVNWEWDQKKPINVAIRHFVKELTGFSHRLDQNLPSMCLSHSSRALSKITQECDHNLLNYMLSEFFESLLCNWVNWELIENTSKRTQWVCSWAYSGQFMKEPCGFFHKIPSGQILIKFMKELCGFFHKTPYG